MQTTQNNKKKYTLLMNLIKGTCYNLLFFLSFNRLNPGGYLAHQLLKTIVTSTFSFFRLFVERAKQLGRQHNMGKNFERKGKEKVKDV